MYHVRRYQSIHINNILFDPELNPFISLIVPNFQRDHCSSNANSLIKKKIKRQVVQLCRKNNSTGYIKIDKQYLISTLLEK